MVVELEKMREGEREMRKERYVEVRVRIMPGHTDLILHYDHRKYTLKILDADRLVLTRKLVNYVLDTIFDEIAKESGIPREKLKPCPLDLPEYILFMTPNQVMSLLDINSKNKNCKTLQRIKEFLAEIEKMEPCCNPFYW